MGKTLLNKINEASKEVFGLDIPFDKIDIHLEDKETFTKANETSLIYISMATRKVLNSKYWELIHNIAGQQETILNKDKTLGYNLTILTEPNMDYNSYYNSFMGTLSHEIGHAVQKHYFDHRGKQTRKDAKGLQAYTKATRLLREIRNNASRLESDYVELISGGEPLGIPGEEKAAKISRLFARAKLLRDNLVMLHKDESDFISSMPTIYHTPEPYKKSADPLVIEAEKIKSRKKLGTKSTDSFYEKIRKNQPLDKRIAQIHEELKPIFKKLKKYDIPEIIERIFPISLQNQEGWATFYEYKIMEHMIQDNIKRQKYCRNYVDAMNARNDIYGDGFTEYNALGSVKKAKQKAGIR